MSTATLSIFLWVIPLIQNGETMAKLALKIANGSIPANLQTLHVLHHCTSHDTCDISVTPSGSDAQLDFGSDDDSAEGSVMDHESIGEPLHPTSTEPGSDPCYANGICESGHGESNSKSDPQLDSGMMIKDNDSHEHELWSTILLLI